MPKNLDAYLVKTPPLHPVAVVTVVAAVAAAAAVVEAAVVEVEAAGPEAAAVAAAAAGPEAAVAAAAAGPEAEEMTMMTMTTMTTMTTMMVHHRVDQVRLVVEPDVGFSTIKKWNSNWPKSYKINDTWQRDVESPVSRPPILSQPHIRMDAVLP